MGIVSSVVKLETFANNSDPILVHKLFEELKRLVPTGK